MLLPPEAWLRDTRRKLERIARFRSHDFRRLVHQAEAKAESAGNQWTELVRELRRQSNAQVRQVLEALGCDADQPNFQTAFFLLASVFLHVGHLKWDPKRSNRNAANWSGETETAFIWEMLRLTIQDPNDVDAVRAIIRCDPKGVRFPHRPKGHIKSGDKAQREKALLRRWQKLKSGPGMDLKSVLGLRDPKTGPAAVLDQLDTADLGRLYGAKIKRAKKSRSS